ncbi:MAG TPA: glycosyltransferase family 1 protein [Bryobacteraceae bacterium]|jgi:glycosyltransferase involved in cell wall biosynthesis
MARIGVNALYLIPGGVGGTEIYLRELLAALASLDMTNEYFVFTNMETGQDLTPQQANFHRKPQAVHATSRPARILWEQTVLPLEAWRFSLDVMFNPGFTAPLAAQCPSVTTFHDLQHKRYPEYFRKLDLPFWKFMLWASAHRSRRLVAVSEATRADLLNFYSLPADRVTVIPHGVNPQFFTLDRSHIEPYLLCVSTLHPHKNIERLVRVYASKPRPHKLVLAGLRGFQTSAIEALIEELGVGGRVSIPGWLPREELIRLYERAHAFVYPSLFEGFGIPVLEAMAAGIPTACSDIPALREVAGEGTDAAALFFDPLDDAALASALDRIATDVELRRTLTAAGPVRARPFTWRRTAEKTLAALL